MSVREFSPDEVTFTPGREFAADELTFTPGREFSPQPAVQSPPKLPQPASPSMKTAIAPSAPAAAQPQPSTAASKPITSGEARENLLQSFEGGPRLPTINLPTSPMADPFGGTAMARLNQAPSSQPTGQSFGQKALEAIIPNFEVYAAEKEAEANTPEARQQQLDKLVFEKAAQHVMSRVRADYLSRELGRPVTPGDINPQAVFKTTLPELREKNFREYLDILGQINDEANMLRLYVGLQPQPHPELVNKLNERFANLAEAKRLEEAATDPAKAREVFTRGLFDEYNAGVYRGTAQLQEMIANLIDQGVYADLMRDVANDPALRKSEDLGDLDVWKPRWWASLIGEQTPIIVAIVTSGIASGGSVPATIGSRTVLQVGKLAVTAQQAASYAGTLAASYVVNSGDYIGDIRQRFVEQGMNPSEANERARAAGLVYGAGAAILDLIPVAKFLPGSKAAKHGFINRLLIQALQEGSTEGAQRVLMEGIAAATGAEFPGDLAELLHQIIVETVAGAAMGLTMGSAAVATGSPTTPQEQQTPARPQRQAQTQLAAESRVTPTGQAEKQPGAVQAPQTTAEPIQETADAQETPPLREEGQGEGRGVQPVGGVPGERGAVEEQPPAVPEAEAVGTRPGGAVIDLTDVAGKYAEAEGVRFDGVQEGGKRNLYQFTDADTGSTFSVAADELSQRAVAGARDAVREKFTRKGTTDVQEAQATETVVEARPEAAPTTGDLESTTPTEAGVGQLAGGETGRPIPKQSTPSPTLASPKTGPTTTTGGAPATEGRPAATPSMGQTETRTPGRGEGDLEPKFEITNNRGQRLGKQTFTTEADARRFLDKKYPNNPMAKSQFAISEVKPMEAQRATATEQPIEEGAGDAAETARTGEPSTAAGNVPTGEIREGGYVIAKADKEQRVGFVRYVSEKSGTARVDWEGKTKPRSADVELDRLVPIDILAHRAKLNEARRAELTEVPTNMDDMKVWAAPEASKADTAKLIAEAQKIAARKTQPSMKKPGVATSPSSIRREGKTDAEVVKAMAASTAKGTSEGFNLNTYKVDQNGQRIAATSGTQLFVVERGQESEGSFAKDGLYENDGGKLGAFDEEGASPDITEILPQITQYDKPTAKLVPYTYEGGQSIEDLWRIVKRAQIMVNPDDQSVLVVQNPDGTLGMGAYTPESGFAEVHIMRGAKPLGALNPKYLLDALRLHIVNGDKSVNIYWPVSKKPMTTRSSFAPGEAGRHTVTTVTMARQSDELVRELGLDAAARTENEPVAGAQGEIQSRQGGEPAKRLNNLSPPSSRAMGGISEAMFMFPARVGMAPFDAIARLARAETLDLIDNIQRVNTPTAEKIVDLSRRQVDLTKRLMGKMQPRKVEALKRIGRNIGSVWTLQDVDWNPESTWGESRLAAAIEGRMPDEQLSAGEKKIVDDIRRLTELTGLELERSGLQIKDRLSGKARPFTHTPGGKVFMRLPTYEMYDILIRGEGTKAYDVLVEAIADMNGMETDQVLGVIAELRGELAGTGEQALRRIGPEFVREWERFPTHISVGGLVIRLLHTSPGSYVTSMVSRVAHRAAFVKIFGQNFADGDSEIGRLAQNFAREGGDPQHVYALARAMHDIPPYLRPGLPGFEPVSPASPAYMLGRGINGIINIIKALNLSRAVIPNIPEPISNTGVFLGYGRMLQALVDAIPFTDARRVAMAQLERAGAITLDVIDWTIDQDRIGTSLSRKISDLIGRVTLIKFINEGQEQWAGLAAVRMVDDLVNARASIGDKEFLRVLGIEPAQVEKLWSGQGTAAEYRAILQRITRFMTGSTAVRAETSPLRNTRTFRFIVPFTEYFSNTMRQMYRLTVNLHDAVKSGDRQRIFHASNLYAKFIGGKAASGVIANFLVAFALGGLAGLKHEWEEMIHDPLAFAWDSFIYSVFGGVWGSIINLIGADDAEGIKDVMANAIYPVSKGLDLLNMVQGNGPYKDRLPAERVGTFLKRNTPFLKTVPGNELLKVLGYGYTDPQMESAISRYWRWRFDNVPPPKFVGREASVMSDENKRKQKAHTEFRRIMRDTYETMRRGEMVDAEQIVKKVVAIDLKDTQSIRDSLRTRLLLNDLDDTQQMELRKSIGDAAYKVLQEHDSNLELLLETFGSKQFAGVEISATLQQVQKSTDPVVSVDRLASAINRSVSLSTLDADLANRVSAMKRHAEAADKAADPQKAEAERRRANELAVEVRDRLTALAPIVREGVEQEQQHPQISQLAEQLKELRQREPDKEELGNERQARLLMSDAMTAINNLRAVRANTNDPAERQRLTQQIAQNADDALRDSKKANITDDDREKYAGMRRTTERQQQEASGDEVEIVRTLITELGASDRPAAAKFNKRYKEYQNATNLTERAQRRRDLEKMAAELKPILLNIANQPQ